MFKGYCLKVRNIIISLMLGVSLNLFSAHASAVTLIANTSVIDTELTKSKLRRIFIMRQTKWSNGDPVKVFVLEQRSELHQTFCKSSLGLFSYQLERQWNKLVYSGLGEAPTVVNDQKTMIEMIASTPGAIGYVDNFIEMEGIRIITLEGGNAIE